MSEKIKGWVNTRNFTDDELTLLEYILNEKCMELMAIHSTIADFEERKENRDEYLKWSELIEKVRKCG